MSGTGPRRNAAVRSPFIVFVALAIAAVSLPLAARPIYKCTLDDGKTTFSDTPCHSDSSQEQLQMRGGAPQPVGRSPEAAAAAAEAAKRAKSGACYGWTPPSGSVAVAPPRRIDPNQLPHDPSGKPVEVFVNKRTPMTVAAACSAMVSACSQKSADPGAMLDTCLKSAPRCGTDHPWDEAQACCPQTCWDAYVELRRHCDDPSTASYKALFEEHCVPGSAEMQRRTTP